MSTSSANAWSSAEIASRIQSTKVDPAATRDEIVAHLEACAEHHFNAAMVSMCWVPLARDVLSGTAVRIATCTGLGLGTDSISAKVLLIRECLALGADEIDYEPNMGYLLSGMDDDFRAEAATVARAADGRPLKAMLELGYLKSEDAVRHAVGMLEEGGVPWIKNSSGWGPGTVAATPENIGLLRAVCRPGTHIKASGQINSFEKAVALLDAGAELLGTSSGVQLLARISASSTGY